MIPARACLLPAILVLALSGCSLFSLSTPEAPAGTQLRACQDAADADPRVRDYWSTTSSTADPNTFQDGYKAMRAKVTNECMRIRSGHPAAGGVEKPLR